MENSKMHIVSIRKSSNTPLFKSRYHMFIKNPFKFQLKKINQHLALFFAKVQFKNI